MVEIKQFDCPFCGGMGSIMNHFDCPVCNEEAVFICKICERCFKCCICSDVEVVK